MDTETSDKNFSVSDQEEMSQQSELVQTVAAVGLLLALTIASGYLPSIKTGVIRIGLDFVPLMIAVFLVKWYWVTFIAVIGDIVKYFLINSAFGAFNPGITLSSVTFYLIWSILLCSALNQNWRFSRKTVVEIVIASILSTVISNVFISTWALAWQQGKSWLLLLPARLPSEGVKVILYIVFGLAIAEIISKFKEYRNSRDY
ncbi:MAG: hypothetical protein LBM13_03530 [Candidatus Ancillula sp.]|jgi:ECF transporter S component (folate family)|nr:hypothetical protein [Candidatus Ancillula sp.]